ncbi:MAG: NAD-dependent epimerase/dehydratase family protein, partial [Chlamydiales bacterium]|nr:NAD-dependent epimerase/dehydratase family protein [Chlamydiales bacterium]
MKLSHDLPIVVTGAFGCIGSCCVRYHNDLGITNLFLVDDFKKTDKWKNLLNKKSLGIISKKELFHWLQGKEDKIGAFIHLGACSDTMETDGDYLMENNFL